MYDMGDETYHVYTRVENITEEDDRHLAGATKEIRNDLEVIIPENPFPEILVEAYPPLKFSWVIPKKLAAMAFPRNKENVQFIVNQGITNLVTLTAGKKPPVDDVARLRWSEIPIDEFELPTIDQIKKFVDICKRADKNDPEAMEQAVEWAIEDGYRLIDTSIIYLTEGSVMGIHCRQGRRRSGVMLACYLVHFHRFLPDQACNVIRMMRPGSLDFPEQEEVVDKYYEDLIEGNPLRFGVSGEVMEEFIEAAKDYTKKVM